MSNIFENKGALAATIVVAASNSLNQAAANYVCDGTADEVEIQAAIDALPAGGGEVVLLEGQYNTTASILMNKPGSILRGQGISTYIVAAGAAHGINVSASEVCLYDFWIDQTTHTGNYDAIYTNAGKTIIFNVDIDAADRNGIRIASTFNRVISCQVQDTDEDGIYIESDNNQIDDCECRGVGTNSIYIGAGCDYNIISNFISYQSGAMGIECRGSDCQITNVNSYQDGHSAIVLYGARDIVSNLLAYDPVIFGIYFEASSTACVASACIVYLSGRQGIYIYQTENIHVENCLIVNANQDNAGYAGIILDASSDCVIVGCTSSGALATYGIEESGACNRNIIARNNLRGNATGGLLVLGANTIYSNQYSDLFMDVLAVSANHVVNAQTLAADPTVCAIAAQPDVPRTLSYTITHPTLTAFTLTFVGVNAKGQTVTEVFTQATGWTGETSNAFATVTSITMSAMTGNTVADTIDVGITDVLGLSNVIYATGDVYKIKKNNANAVVAAAQVNTTYDTYDMAVIGLAVGDDFTIYFRSNLNIVA